IVFFYRSRDPRDLHSFPTRRSSDLVPEAIARGLRVIDLSGAWRLQHRGNRQVYGFEDKDNQRAAVLQNEAVYGLPELHGEAIRRSEEHTSELQSRENLVCRLLLEKK